MKFKNSNQRRAVMLRLREVGMTPVSAKFYSQHGMTHDDIVCLKRVKLKKYRE